jgi:hypothetical protein
MFFIRRLAALRDARRGNDDQLENNHYYYSLLFDRVFGACFACLVFSAALVSEKLNWQAPSTKKTQNIAKHVESAQTDFARRAKVQKCKT